MKELLFGEGLLQPTLEGKKRITIRKYRLGAHTFAKGDYVRGKFADGLDLVLVITEDTVVKPFRELTDEEAREDGFSDANAVLPGMQHYYSDLGPDDAAGVIRFRIPEIDGIPVVCVTE